MMMATHSNECPFELIQCYFCKEKLMRKELVAHQMNTCQEFVISCPMKCGEKVLRKNLDSHKKTCPEELVDCPYRCKTKVTGKNLYQHMEDNLTAHLHFAFESLNTFEAKVKILEEKNTSLEFENALLHATYEEKMKHLEISFENKLKLLNDMFEGRLKALQQSDQISDPLSSMGNLSLSNMDDLDDHLELSNVSDVVPVNLRASLDEKNKKTDGEIEKSIEAAIAKSYGEIGFAGIPDTAFICSSSWNWKYEASQSRLNRGRGWCSGFSRIVGEWIQVCLGSTKQLYALQVYFNPAVKFRMVLLDESMLPLKKN